jgi:radical SAM superfamily enzyme YgiQ (UPF0313 family)
MKVLFIESPPSVGWEPKSGITTGGRRHPSLAFAGETTYSYLSLSAAAVLRDGGHDVRYLHCQTEGVIFERLKKIIADMSPDILVVYVEHVTALVDFAIANYAKSLGTTVVFTGPFVTPVAEKIFEKCPGVDIITLKEYDYTILDIANALEKKKDLSAVRGIKYRKGRAIKHTRPRELIQNLDKLPFPAFDLIKLKKFYETIFMYFPAATTITSRGCPYQCFFCTFPRVLYSHQFRAQSPERVLAEARYLQDEFGVKEIRYDDDTFEIDAKRAFAICDLFRQEKLDVRWNPQSRANNMTRDLTKAMASAGCIRIMFGVESGDDAILQKMNKGETTRQIWRGIMNARNADIIIHNCIMFGFPWDTRETLEKTLKFACKLNAEFTQFSITTPLPGTPYYEMMIKEDRMLGEDWERDSFQASSITNANLSNDELNNFFKDVRKRYYFRPEWFYLVGKRMMRNPAFFRLMMRISMNWHKHKKAGDPNF